MFVSNTMANAIAPRELASTSGSALDHYTCTHVEALRWLLDIDGPDIDEDELKAASHSFGELLSLMRSHPAETLEGLLRTDFEPCIAPLKRMSCGPAS